MHRLPYILTGGPGTGKSTVLDQLESSGCVCVPESAREIIQARMRQGLPPRLGPKAFARAILGRDIERYQSIPSTEKPVFIDRGLVDALSMLEQAGDIDLSSARTRLDDYPVSKQVFFFHPWKEIYRNDSERDQSYVECQRVSARLESWYISLGFELVDVPHGNPQARADFILRTAHATQMG
jgi:predicted ATPase